MTKKKKQQQYRDRRARVATHIRVGDVAKIEKLRRYIERETGIIELSTPDVISRALQIAIEYYKMK